MAITHNLSDPSDNLSGLDPTAGLSGAVGKGWLLWKIFEELSTFDTTIKKITNASPTPTFLQGEVGVNLQTEPAQNRGVIGDSICWYKTDDPGLSQTPANAMVYEWRLTNTVTAQTGWTSRQRFVEDGETVYAPGVDNDWCNGTTASVGASIYQWQTGSTTIDYTLVPRVIFWKSSNAVCIVGVNKLNGSQRGGVMIFNPTFQGYKATIGATTEGVNHRGLVQFVLAGGHHMMEGFSQTYGATTGTTAGLLTTNLDVQNSGGTMPEALLTFSSENNLIAGKLRLALYHASNFKSISDEIEGVRLSNPANASLPAGAQIAILNSKYYLGMGSMADGRNTHKVLLELEAA